MSVHAGKYSRRRRTTSTSVASSSCVDDNTPESRRHTSADSKKFGLSMTDDDDDSAVEKRIPSATMSSSAPDLHDFDFFSAECDEPRHHEFCERVLRAEAPSINGSKISSVYVPYHNAMCTISMWISMFIRVFYSTRSQMDPKNVYYMNYKCVEKMLRSAVFMGTYMWWVISIRLQVRRTRSDTCRGMANREDMRSSSSIISDSSSGEDEDDKDGDNEAIVRMLHAERKRMCEVDFLSSSCSITLDSVMREFHFNKVIKCRWTVPIRIKESHAEMCKRFVLANSIYNNGDRELTKLYDLEIPMETGDVIEVSRKLTMFQSIDKSTWHLFHAMPIEFHMYMLLWMEMDDGSDPHMSFVRARPMFEYMFECISSKGGSGEVLIFDRNERDAVDDTNFSSTVDADYTSEEDEHQLVPYFRSMIESIDKSADRRDCTVCRDYLISILSGSGSSTPGVDQEFARCPIAKCASDTKKRVQNLTKSIDKSYVSGEHPRATAVVPILKQIITNITAKASAYANRNSQGSLYTRKAKKTTCSIVNKYTLERPYDVSTIDEMNVRLPRHISDLADLTVYPLTLTELTQIRDVHSFSGQTYSASGRPLTMSVHVLDPHMNRDESRYLIYDSSTYGGRNNSAGTAYVVQNRQNLISFWENCPFGQSSKSMRIELYSLSTRGTVQFKESFIDSVGELIESTQ